MAVSQPPHLRLAGRGRGAVMVAGALLGLRGLLGPHLLRLLLGFQPLLLLIALAALCILLGFPAAQEMQLYCSRLLC